MFSRVGGSGSWSISFAWLHACEGSVGDCTVMVVRFGLGNMFLATFLSFAIRLSCLVSDLAMEGAIWFYCRLRGVGP